MNPNDSDNFLAFLKTLRADPTMTNLMITAATSILPFVGTDGSPKSDVSEFAKVFDWIAIMNYDVWGVRLTSSLKTSISLMPFVFHLVLVQQRWP